MVTPFFSVLAVTQALVLYQFMATVPYEHVFNLIRDNIGELDATLFEFLWDIPIFETLISTSPPSPFFCTISFHAAPP